MNRKKTRKVSGRSKRNPVGPRAIKKKALATSVVTKKVRQPKTIEQFFGYALDNVSRYGDTDIFPYPIEKKVFFDNRQDALGVLCDIHADFDKYLLEMPPTHERLLSAVGYAGFRGGTIIDPIWNVYFLGLVLSIGSDLEKARIAKEKDIVFSYRLSLDPENNRLFDVNYGWLQFQKKSAESAKSHSFVLTCDISDFYPRIYHHRLENALKKATQNTEAIRRIKELLSVFQRAYPMACQ